MVSEVKSSPSKADLAELEQLRENMFKETSEVSRYTKFAIIAIWLFSFMDNAIATETATRYYFIFEDIWNVSAVQLGMIGTIASLGAAVAMLFRFAADKYGRRTMTFITCEILMLTSFAIFFAYDFISFLIIFTFCHIFNAIDIHSIYLFEVLPDRIRARTLGIMAALTSAWTLIEMNLVAYIQYVGSVAPWGTQRDLWAGTWLGGVERWGPYYWKFPMIGYCITPIGLIIFPILYLKLKETGRFMYTKKLYSIYPERRPKLWWSEVVRPPYLKWTLLTVGVGVIYNYGFMSTNLYWHYYLIYALIAAWGPTIGYGTAKDIAILAAGLLGSVCVIAFMIAYAISGWLADRVGRKNIMFILAYTSWIVRVMFGSFPSPLTLMFTLQIGAIGLYASIWAVGLIAAEIFPTRIRASRGAWSYFLNMALGGTLASLFVAWVADIYKAPMTKALGPLWGNVYNWGWSFAVQTWVWPVVLLLVYFFYPETAGKTLEEIQMWLFPEKAKKEEI